MLIKSARCLHSSLRYLTTNTRLTQELPVRRLTKASTEISLDSPFSQFKQAVPHINDKIVVAMSGGVDSSLTAALFAAKYPNVRGIYMANWSQTAKCTEADWNDVKRVCRKLGIECERVNFEKEYWTDVFAPMIDMYQRGLTPNPDLGCNRHIKFGKMAQYLRLGPSESGNKTWLATGHYARIVKETVNGSDVYSLARAYEDTKDQSYYLASISQDILKNVLMPLGHNKKSDVRLLAKNEFDLHTAAKKDSVGLCFVSPDHSKFRDFLNEYIPSNPGNIITEDGKIWGQHQGLWHATIGQKSGITMPQGDPQYKGIWFVSEKRVASNEIVIVRGRDNPALFKKKVSVVDWEWFGEKPADLCLDNITMRYQSLHKPVAVKLLDVLASDEVTITLSDRQRAMAPGQNIVLYDGLKVLASGRIAKTME